MRVISMVKFSLAPTTENSKALPSTPSAIYSLVNILMTALFHLHDENGKEKKLGYNTDDNRQSFQNEYNHVRDNILDLLDQLANAGLITLNKKFCEQYLGAEAGPDFTPQDVKKVVKYCIMEGICKCFLNRRVLQENKAVFSPPSGISDSVDRNARMHERKCEVLIDLLEVVISKACKLIVVHFLMSVAHYRDIGFLKVNNVILVSSYSPICFVQFVSISFFHRLRLIIMT
jgi:hypothetical protein